MGVNCKFASCMVVKGYIEELFNCNKLKMKYESTK